MKIYDFLKIGAPFYLCTSVILLPIQGTTPAFLQLFLIAALIFIRPKHFSREIYLFVTFVFSYILYVIISQLIVFFSDFQPAYGLPVISKVYSTDAFQNVIFTQSIYLIPCFMAYLGFSRMSFNDGLRILKISAMFLCFYGFYEVAHYIALGSSGDFLTNRSYGNNVKGSGSLFQTISIGGFHFQRLASLTQEPSAFAYTILPLAIIFGSVGLMKTTYTCILALIFSTSGTFFFGSIIPIVYSFWGVVVKGITTLKISRRNVFFLCALFLILIVVFAVFSDGVRDLISKLVDKVSGDSISGQQRGGHFILSFSYWINELNIGLKLFGIGFGITRPTNMLMFLLVNTGLFGLVFYIYFFMRPLFFLPNDRIANGLKIALITHIFMSMASVPEFSILTSWSILGLCYSYRKHFKDCNIETHILSIEK